MDVVWLILPQFWDIIPAGRTSGNCSTSSDGTPGWDEDTFLLASGVDNGLVTQPVDTSYGGSITLDVAIATTPGVNSSACSIASAEVTAALLASSSSAVLLTVEYLVLRVDSTSITIGDATWTPMTNVSVSGVANVTVAFTSLSIAVPVAAQARAVQFRLASAVSTAVQATLGPQLAVVIAIDRVVVSVVPRILLQGLQFGTVFPDAGPVDGDDGLVIEVMTTSQVVASNAVLVPLKTVPPLFSVGFVVAGSSGAAAITLLSQDARYLDDTSTVVYPDYISGPTLLRFTMPALPALASGVDLTHITIDVTASGVSVISPPLPFSVYNRPTPLSLLPQSLGIAGLSTLFTFAVTPALDTQRGVVRGVAEGSGEVVSASVAVSEGGQGVVPSFYDVVQSENLPDLAGLPLSRTNFTSRFLCSYSALEMGLQNRPDGNVDGLFIDRLYFKVVNVPVTDTGVFMIDYAVVRNNNVLRSLGDVTDLGTLVTVYSVPTIPRSSFVVGQWMEFVLTETIVLIGMSSHLVLRVTSQHSLLTDPRAFTASADPGTAVIFQMQEVWDARAVRMFTSSTRSQFNSALYDTLPYNAVLSVKLCEQGAACPQDLVAQVLLPQFATPLQPGATVALEFAMNGVSFDPLLPVYAFDESRLRFKDMAPRLGSITGSGTRISMFLSGPLPLVDEAGLERWQSVPVENTDVSSANLAPPVDSVTVKISSPGGVFFSGGGGERRGVPAY